MHDAVYLTGSELHCASSSCCSHYHHHNPLQPQPRRSSGSCSVHSTTARKCVLVQVNRTVLSIVCVCVCEYIRTYMHTFYTSFIGLIGRICELTGEVIDCCCTDIDLFIELESTGQSSIHAAPPQLFFRKRDNGRLCPSFKLTRGKSCHKVYIRCGLNHLSSI